LVYQGLGGQHRFNTDRHHTFILQGAREDAHATDLRYRVFDEAALARSQTGDELWDLAQTRWTSGRCGIPIWVSAYAGTGAKGPESKVRSSAVRPLPVGYWATSLHQTGRKKSKALHARPTGYE
jgi:hypothetical protein